MKINVNKSIIHEITTYQGYHTWKTDVKEYYTIETNLRKEDYHTVEANSKKGITPWGKNVKESITP